MSAAVLAALFCLSGALARANQGFSLETSWTVGFVRPVPGRPRGGGCRITATGVELSTNFFQRDPETREYAITWTADVANGDALVALIKAAQPGPFIIRHRIPDAGSHLYRAENDGEVVPLIDGGMLVQVNQAPEAARIIAFIDKNCVWE